MTGQESLGTLVYWTPEPETRLTGTLVAFSDPENVWVRWAGRRDDERVSIEELAVIA